MVAAQAEPRPRAHGAGPATDPRFSCCFARREVFMEAHTPRPRGQHCDDHTLLNAIVPLRHKTRAVCVHPQICGNVAWHRGCNDRAHDSPDANHRASCPQLRA